MSAPPEDRLYAATPAGLGYSSDGGCSWSFAAGSFAAANVVDVFPDANDSTSVFAIARVSADLDAGGESEGVYQSTDGGRSFGATALFTAPPMVGLTGVEKARSSPWTLYLTMLSSPPLTPSVARSTAGSPFAVLDESAFTMSTPYLAAVDPSDASILYLRLRAAGDALRHFARRWQHHRHRRAEAGRMSALLRRANGTLLVGSSNAQSLRSLDGGKSFAPWDAAPHVRALAERGDMLYVVASDPLDHFVVARSSDEGAHWTRSSTFVTYAGRSRAAICRRSAPGPGPRSSGYSAPVTAGPPSMPAPRLRPTARAAAARPEARRHRRLSSASPSSSWQRPVRSCPLLSGGIHDPIGIVPEHPRSLAGRTIDGPGARRGCAESPAAATALRPWNRCRREWW